jgi:N-acetylglucosaminyldiphosphoundecaprenol N-acetyl-beta-D-mannosaminyltransferase
MNDLDTVHVGDLAFDVVETREAAQRIVRMRFAGGGLIVTPNLDHLRRASADPALRDLYSRASLTLADGMPVVWLARLMGVRLQRVTGADLFPQICEIASACGVPITIVGTPSPATASALERKLNADFPALAVSVVSPRWNFEKNGQQLNELAQEIRRQRSAIVFLCLGSPKQERVAATLLNLAPGTTFIGAGAAADIYLGLFKRAPRWMQATGLEWTYRLLQEPRRLATRYLSDAVFFIKVLVPTALRR